MVKMKGMMKRFNITGSCNPERHYMVDTAERFAAVEKMIDMGDYFTINRARQYGKTTTLDMIWRHLSDRYMVVPLSFEGLDDGAYESHKAFVTAFMKQMARQIMGIDLVVNYGKEEFIVELKIWRGTKYEQNGRDQLSDYLKIRDKKEGYLVTFDLSKNKPDVEPQWIEHNGKRIYETIV